MLKRVDLYLDDQEWCFYKTIGKQSAMGGGALLVRKAMEFYRIKILERKSKEEILDYN